MTPLDRQILTPSLKRAAAVLALPAPSAADLHTALAALVLRLVLCQVGVNRSPH